MTRRRIRSLCLILLAAVQFFPAACAREKAVILSPYRELLLGREMPLEQSFARESGITGGVCIIEDESVFNPALLQASAGAIFNITDRSTIFSLNAFTRQKIASLTKLMTAYLTLKYADLNSTVVLGNEVIINDPDAWLCGFKPGDEVRIRDLLASALVYSGNDAANALGVAVSGSLSAFTELMNKEALELGATGSSFENPNGLDRPGQYSTVYDIYLIFNACLTFPEFRQLIALPQLTLSYKTASGETVSKQFSSGNAYLNKTASAPSGIRVVGGKTGHTNQAGYCLAMLSTDSGGNEYISIVLGTKTKQQVYAQTNLLFEMVLEQDELSEP